MYDAILVPTDGSDPANRAVEHALVLAKHYDACVHAMYCVETYRYGEPALSSTALVLNQLEEQGQAMLEELGDRADNAGIEYSDRDRAAVRTPWLLLEQPFPLSSSWLILRD